MDKKEYIQSKIRDIKDFPKEGIIFKDITPLLMDVKGVEYVIDLLVENLHGQKIDKVVGMESRGQDVLEIHEDAISKGEKVLIHDDILATGGTAEAVVKLVERLGGDIVQLDFLMELHFLKGRDKLKNYKVYSIL